MTDLVKNIKDYRVAIDKAFKFMEEMPRSREISIAITSAQNSKMWLGQTLKTLDEPNPYPDSKDATNTKIAPTADVFDGDIKKELEGIDNIRKIKIIRKSLSDVYEDMGVLINEALFDPSKESRKGVHHAQTKSYEYCIESVMWLGMELGRIRDNDA